MWGFSENNKATDTLKVTHYHHQLTQTESTFTLYLQPGMRLMPTLSTTQQWGWVTSSPDVAIAFSHLTPGLPTEWTHFPLWLQLLPVMIQLSNSSPVQVPVLTCLSYTSNWRHHWHFKFRISRNELTILPLSLFHVISPIKRNDSQQCPRQKASSLPHPVITITWASASCSCRLSPRPLLWSWHCLMPCPHLFSL